LAGGVCTGILFLTGMKGMNGDFFPLEWLKGGFGVGFACLIIPGSPPENDAGFNDDA
jgi:hypothetical protein